MLSDVSMRRRSTFLGLLFLSSLVGCGAAAPPPSTPVSETTLTSASLPAATALEDPVPLPPLEPDYHAQAIADADKVVAAMHDDLVRCGARAWGDASVYAEVVIGPDGDVLGLTTTGGANLGERAMRCIRRRIERATFAPVHGGGTLHLTIPLTFTRKPLDDDE